MGLPQGSEWIIILVIVLIVFGVGKLPQIGGAVGKSIREFREASREEPTTPVTTVDNTNTDATNEKTG